MQQLIQIETGDRELLSGIDNVMAEAVRRGGDWIACRPGCTQCCVAPFAITQLDAWRLRKGLSALNAADPDRAQRLRGRAEAYIAAIDEHSPGRAASGEPWDEDHLPSGMDDVPCPALDPETGLCDLYSARPIICRTFGPATRVGDGRYAACELCYVGATDEETARCAVDVDPEGSEDVLLNALSGSGASGMTLVAYALTMENWDPDGR